MIGFSAEEMASVRRILAAILHLVSLPLGRPLRPLPCPLPGPLPSPHAAPGAREWGRLASDRSPELSLLPAAWL